MQNTEFWRSHFNTLIEYRNDSCRFVFALNAASVLAFSSAGRSAGLIAASVSLQLKVRHHYWDRRVGFVIRSINVFISPAACSGVNLILITAYCFDYGSLRACNRYWKKDILSSDSVLIGLYVMKIETEVLSDCKQVSLYIHGFIGCYCEDELGIFGHFDTGHLGNFNYQYRLRCSLFGPSLKYLQFFC